jgi:GNAT superfamily N-acetyltransferase
MNKIKILKAKPENVRGIQNVYYKTWLATYPNKKYRITAEDIEYKFKDRSKKEEIGKRIAKIKKQSKNDLQLVAKEGNKIVGVCGVEKDASRNKLRSIYVLPTYQGHGIGKMFWNRVQRFFDPRKDIVVHVASYNKNAIAFYERCGFKDTKKRFTDERHKMRNGAIIPEMELIIKRKTDNNTTNKMKTSKEVIEYLKKNIDRKDYTTFFTAGSLPEKLIPQSDLDLFFVIRNDRVDQFFDRLTRIMKRFLGNDRSARYSLFRGPLKYKNQGLIHFIVYTEDANENTNMGDAFKSELNHVKKSLLKTADIVSGSELKHIIKAEDLKNEKLSKKHIDKMKMKYTILKTKGYIKFREWKKTKNGWRFTYTRKYASDWFKDYLIHYYKKNLERK